MKNCDPVLVFDVFLKETDTIVVAVEATDSKQALKRAALVIPGLQVADLCGVQVVVKEHDANTPVISTWYRDGHFLVLEERALNNRGLAAPDESGSR